MLGLRVLRLFPESAEILQNLALRLLFRVTLRAAVSRAHALSMLKNLMRIERLVYTVFRTFPPKFAGVRRSLQISMNT